MQSWQLGYLLTRQLCLADSKIYLLIDAGFFQPDVQETISSAELEEEGSSEGAADDSTGPLPSSLDVGSELARSYLDSALNPVTVRQYKGALQRWETFCAQNGLPLTPAGPCGRLLGSHCF